MAYLVKKSIPLDSHGKEYIAVKVKTEPKSALLWFALSLAA